MKVGDIVRPNNNMTNPLFDKARVVTIELGIVVVRPLDGAYQDTDLGYGKRGLDVVSEAISLDDQLRGLVDKMRSAGYDVEVSVTPPTPETYTL